MIAGSWIKLSQQSEGGTVVEQEVEQQAKKQQQN
jgi:hypothetical protein